MYFAAFDFIFLYFLISANCFSLFLNVQVFEFPSLYVCVCVQLVGLCVCISVFLYLSCILYLASARTCLCVQADPGWTDSGSERSNLRDRF